MLDFECCSNLFEIMFLLQKDIRLINFWNLIQLNPKLLVIPWRHAFLIRKQLKEETISQYVVELRKLVLPFQYTSAMVTCLHLC